MDTAFTYIDIVTSEGAYLKDFFELGGICEWLVGPRGLIALPLPACFS
jgi:hypothetical protein